MIYNRYIPDSNGIYRQQRVVSKEERIYPCDSEKKVDQSVVTPAVKQEVSAIDLGDVLLLCIAILLILEADGDDMTSVIIAIAAFIFLQ